MRQRRFAHDLALRAGALPEVLLRGLTTKGEFAALISALLTVLETQQEEEETTQ